MKGIYKFTNLINGKSYVGQSINLDARYKSHLRGYKNINHPSYNSLFYKALRKYGIQNFKYEILYQKDDLTIEELNTLEQNFIKKYNSFGENGYNMNPGGDSTGGNYFIPYDKVLAIKNELFGTDKSSAQITKEFNLSSESIVSSINKGFTYNFVGDFKYPIRDREKINTIYQGGKNGRAIFSDEKVLNLRRDFVVKSLEEIYQEHKDEISFSALKKIIYGVHYKHLPIYKKREKKWYLNGTCIDYFH